MPMQSDKVATPCVKVFHVTRILHSTKCAGRLTKRESMSVFSDLTSYLITMIPVTSALFIIFPVVGADVQ